jgi:hypothetical protein
VPRLLFKRNQLEPETSKRFGRWIFLAAAPSRRCSTPDYTKPMEVWRLRAFDRFCQAARNGCYLRTAVVPSLRLNGRQSTLASAVTGSSHPSNPHPSAARCLPAASGLRLLTTENSNFQRTARLASISGLISARTGCQTSRGFDSEFRPFMNAKSRART